MADSEKSMVLMIDATFAESWASTTGEAQSVIGNIDSLMSEFGGRQEALGSALNDLKTQAAGFGETFSAAADIDALIAGGADSLAGLNTAQEAALMQNAQAFAMSVSAMEEFRHSASSGDIFSEGFTDGILRANEAIGDFLAKGLSAAGETASMMGLSPVDLSSLFAKEQSGDLVERQGDQAPPTIFSDFLGDTSGSLSADGSESLSGACAGPCNMEIACRCDCRHSRDMGGEGLLSTIGSLGEYAMESLGSLPDMLAKVLSAAESPGALIRSFADAPGESFTPGTGQGDMISPGLLGGLVPAIMEKLSPPSLSTPSVSVTDDKLNTPIAEVSADASLFQSILGGATRGAEVVWGGITDFTGAALEHANGMITDAMGSLKTFFSQPLTSFGLGADSTISHNPGGNNNVAFGGQGTDLASIIMNNVPGIAGGGAAATQADAIDSSAPIVSSNSGSRVINHAPNISINITQQAGEDGEALANRVMAMIAERDQSFLDNALSAI